MDLSTKAPDHGRNGVTLIVVNGEQDWSRYLPGYTVQHQRLQISQWLFRDGRLWVFDRTSSVRVDSVLWRVGAIRPHPNHRAVLRIDPTCGCAVHQFSVGAAAQVRSLNLCSTNSKLLTVPDAVREYTTCAMAHFQADMLGLDFLETTDGTYLVLESNDTPGLAAFPDEVRSAVARLVRRKLET